MFDIMYLADIEIISDPQLDEYTLVLMHRYPCFVKQLEGFVTVDLKMGVVDEVDECSEAMSDLWILIHRPCHCPQENLFHVLVLVTSPLCCR